MRPRFLIHGTLAVHKRLVFQVSTVVRYFFRPAVLYNWAESLFPPGSDRE
jgi:hypothetical protein